MKLDTKCSLALHCIVFIAVFQDRTKVTSELLSKSTGSNAVIIRNILSALKKAGIVTVARGVGGARIACELDRVSIWDVYNAIEPEGLEQFIGRHPRPNEACPVGRVINGVLDSPYSRISDAVKSEMQSISLQQLYESYKQLHQIEKEKKQR